MYTADYIFIATGDYSFPYHPFSYGLHYSEIQTFTQLKGDAFTIIGGNESAFDAAINLSQTGAKYQYIHLKLDLKGRCRPKYKIITAYSTAITECYTRGCINRNACWLPGTQNNISKSFL